MKKINEYSREKFTDKEVVFAHTVADAVCKVFGIENHELRGISRKSKFTDARKAFCHYLSNNIVLEKVPGSYHVALATWYLNVHHSTVCYAVEQGNNLYATDELFRNRYDNLINLMADPYNYQIKLVEKPRLEPKKKKEYTWEEIKLSYGIPNRIKEQLIPIKVSQRIKEMYHLGYSFVQIAYQICSTETFVSYYVKKNGFQRGEFATKIKTKGRGEIKVSIPAYASKIDY